MLGPWEVPNVFTSFLEKSFSYFIQFHFSIKGIHRDMLGMIKATGWAGL